MKIILSIVLCLAFFSGCRENPPEIFSIEPPMGRMGDIITIRGSGFGNERNAAFITIAGTAPTSSSYLSWNDEEITVITPQFGEGGLVLVHRGRLISNPVLFIDEAVLPVAANQETGNIPRINLLEPASGPIGSLITIRGSNFGTSRGNSGVFFSWTAETSQNSPARLYREFVEAFESEFGYELWGDRKIQVRVPDGAVSGDIKVRTSRGESQPVFFEITGKPGTKTFKDRRSYLISYSVNIEIERAFAPNNLFIWMPKPAVSASQRNTRLVSRNIEPFVDNFRGSSLFQFTNILSQTSREITLSYFTEVYAVETQIRNHNPVRLNRPSPGAIIYTLPSALIPSDNPAIRARAAEIAGRERLPFVRAQMIYNWLVSFGGIQLEPLGGGVIEALQEGRADSFQAALLFCALARALDIPANPVAGILIDRYMNASRHYWAEFWLDGFGWIPLDPALGAGAAPENFDLRPDHARYYFGNLDSKRIAFSRGERFLPQMTPHGRTVTRARGFSLQNFWEEAAGGIESYSSFWSDVRIKDISVQ